MVKSALMSGAFSLWGAGLLVSLLVAAGLVWWIIPSPVWWAAGLGWSLVLANALVARAIHAKATNGGRGGFIRWGLVGNGIRMLTLVLIFAYMTLHFKGERSSFLVSGLTCFFVLLPVEIVQLFRFQDKGGLKVECGNDAN